MVELSYFIQMFNTFIHLKLDVCFAPNANMPHLPPNSALLALASVFWWRPVNPPAHHVNTIAGVQDQSQKKSHWQVYHSHANAKVQTGR